MFPEAGVIVVVREDVVCGGLWLSEHVALEEASEHKEERLAFYTAVGTPCISVALCDPVANVQREMSFLVRIDAALDHRGSHADDRRGRAVRPVTCVGPLRVS